MIRRSIFSAVVVIAFAVSASAQTTERDYDRAIVELLAAPQTADSRARLYKLLLQREELRLQRELKREVERFLETVGMPPIKDRVP